MIRGKPVGHDFESPVDYAFKAMFHTEEDGTLSTHPQPPTTARSQACLTDVGQAQPIRECFEGEDKRVRIVQPDIWPYSIHAQIESRSSEGRPFSGSGVMVGPHHFLTAGHCVHDGRMGGWAQSLTIYPGLNDATAPFGAARGVRAYLYQEWVQSENPDFDIALVILDNSIGNETGWAGMMALPEEELCDRKVHVTGYPGDTNKRNQMWTMEDCLERIDPETFAYKMHTSGGQSGGGIWIKQLASPVVVGVHTMGYVGRNFGVRLSKQKLQNVIAWMEETGVRQGSVAVTMGPSSSFPSHSLVSQEEAEEQFRLGQKHEKSLDGLPQDDREALKCYRIAAQKGHAEAQYAIGCMYAAGRGGLLKNGTEAAKFYKFAADQGHVDAQCRLGWMYANDQGGLRKNDAEALRFFQLAAEQGHPRVQCLLGLNYEGKDDVEALKWYKLAADQGDAKAQFEVGRMYQECRGGLSKNDAEALRFFQLAADQGYGQAQSELRNKRWDTYRLRLKANQGDREAQHALGVMYDSDEDFGNVEAFKWFKLAADQGYAPAQKALRKEKWERNWEEVRANQGDRETQYKRGLRVYRFNPVEGAKLFRLAADQGHIDAQASLGAMYSLGEGVAKNDTEAIRLFRLAAEQGSLLAQINLGRIYEDGTGVAKDYREAMKWYRKAAEKGNEEAKEALGRLNKCVLL